MDSNHSFFLITPNSQGIEPWEVWDLVSNQLLGELNVSKEFISVAL